MGAEQQLPERQPFPETLMRTALVILLATVSVPCHAWSPALSPEALEAFDHDPHVWAPTATLQMHTTSASSELDELCGSTITGTVVLDRDVDCSGSGIVIGAGAVLDLNGFTYTGRAR